MLCGALSLKFTSLVLGGVPADSSGTDCGLLARADDSAEAPAVGTEELSLREGSSLVPPICTAPEIEACRDGVCDWPGTGEDSRIVDTCLPLCDLDTEPDREPAIELESSRCLMSRGRDDMIGYPDSRMQLAVQIDRRPQ